MPNCPHCSRSFGSAHALKIHIGRSHKSAAAKAGRGRKKKAKRGRPPGKKGAAADLTEVSTAALAAELRRRAEIADRLKSIVG